MDMNFSKTAYQPYLEALDKLGFCTFKIFRNGEPDQLRALYAKHFSGKKIDRLYASHNSNPAEQSLSISAAIKEVVHEAIRNIFPDYRYFIGHFMVKGAHVNKEFALHQDWNIVQESKHNNYQIWIPLQFTCPTNGGIFVLPGSHKFFLGNHRSGSYGIPVVPFEDRLKPLVTDIIVPPGNVLIYHNGLFHASHPNNTDTDRLAVIVNYVEKKAPTYYFQKNALKDCTDLYSIDGEKLITHLPELEKGIVHPSIPFAETEALCPVDNATIHADTLINQYREKMGSVSAAQLKQLHITVSVDLEEKLNREGYTVIDLLDEQTTELFKREYHTHFGNIDRTPGRFTTLQHVDIQMKKQMHAFIIQHVDAALRKYFKDFIIPVSQFYTKKAFTSGDIDIHADTTLLLNHQLEPHYAIWIPLIDVHAGNGTLTVIPFSHKINRALFSSSFGGYHNQHTAWLRQFEVPLTLKAGQAVIFDNNLLHNSTANTTSTDRLCFTFRITHSGSQYYSFFSEKPEERAVAVSEESHNYYMADDWDGNSRQVTGNYIGTYINGFIQIQKEELEMILKPAMLVE